MFIDSPSQVRNSEQRQVAEALGADVAACTAKGDPGPRARAAAPLEL